MDRPQGGGMDRVSLMTSLKEKKDNGKGEGKIKKKGAVSCDCQLNLFKNHGESEFKRL